MRGGGGADRIEGGAGDDVVQGGDGDDRILHDLESGVDQIFGGVIGADSGFDTLDYSAATAGVIVQLSGYSTTSGGALLATFSGIEGAVGTAFDDALIGDGADNRLRGGGGSDWLVGGDGDDWFEQGSQSGVDQIFGDSSFDTITFSDASSSINVNLAGGEARSGTGVLRAQFTGIEAAIGTSFNDTLVGTDADNRLEGGDGDDVIEGGAGADWLVGGPATTALFRVRTKAAWINCSAMPARTRLIIRPRPAV